MQKIPLNLAKEGMVLAKPVLRDNGLVLVAQGTELSSSLLERLERMDVDKVVVEGNPVDLDGAAGGTEYTTRIERLDHLFRKFQADPWMNQLKEDLRNYFQVKAAAQAAALAEQEAEAQEAAQGEEE
ncbi:MAG: hypothetical protein D6E12_14775 [Desulfovibrio sp.]|nr:MAG: hypothetical protein D6E12_14775 [Desulfovibrio sp.]